MELSPALKTFAKRLLPHCLLRRLARVECSIEDAVSDFAQKIPAGSVVLDAGCGENRFKRYFKQTLFIGYDRCIGDDEWDYSKVDVVGDLHTLAFRDSSVGASLLIVSLEHAKEPAKVISELHRILKKDAPLLMVVPLLWEVHQAPNDFYRFTRFALQNLLEEAGLEINKIVPIGGFFSLFARRCVNMLSFLQRGWLWILFITLLPLLGFIFPLAFDLLDFLDKKKNFTLAYIVEAQKSMD